MIDENHSTIGYGSIFLPPSLMRVDDSVGSADEIYEEGREYGDRDIMRENAVEAWAWDEKEGAKTFVPVKIDGLRRNYNFESEKGGAMLDVEREEDSWINGVIVTGLDGDEKEALTSSEGGYELESIDRSEITPYLQEHEELVDQAAEEGVSIYIGKSEPTERGRNQVYQDRIRTGIDMIGEMYGEDLAEELWRDFKRTTYENPVPGSKPEEGTDYEEWARWSNTLEQNERALEAFNNLMDDDFSER